MTMASALTLVTTDKPASAKTEKARLLVVDDSKAVRLIFRRILERDRLFEVAGMCASTDEALQFLDRNAVDIILLDIEMPGRNGLDALPEILRRSGGAAVIVISSHVTDAGSTAVAALSLGACDTLSKPGSSAQSTTFSTVLVEKISAIAADRFRRIDPPIPLPRPAVVRRLDCIGVGASTGGIAAIQQFLERLPDAVDCPILLTQHLPANFIPYFASQLQQRTGRRVHVAVPGTRFDCGGIYIAPGDGHLGCHRRGSSVYAERLDGPCAVNYSPAVDPMMVSMAACYGAAAFGIVFSGMGSDGLEGARQLRAVGANVVVQDQASSVVWGMPGSIAKAGLADAILRPADMGNFLLLRQGAI